MHVLELRTTAWWHALRGMLVMIAIGWGVVSVPPRPAWHGLGLAAPLLLPVVAAGWVLWTLRRNIGAAVVLALAGGLALAILHPRGAALAYPAIACLWAGYRLSRRWSLPLAAAACLLYPLAGFVASFGWWLVIGPAAFLVALMAGLIRRQNEALAEETRLAREEQARAAALGERARIAREIHDVLAHSLAALAVQLETADALLESGRAEQARRSLVRAGQLAREGLAETRRAIGALRGETLPLPELLDALAAGYRADFGVPATIRVEGRPCELGADTTLALYRSVQEAMTNVRKHAPGAPVRVDLRYSPEEVSLRVVNGAPPDGAARPLAAVGGGYGLTGLRERAQLAGGAFEAGPADDGYRVDVRIPV
jgi:signal transduction histidine kinase